MKCRRVKKLIPLYVEGDIASGVADRIAAHLDWCGGCNWLADEYRESQSWLRSSNVREFDEVALNAVKAGVLARIAEANMKPSLLASLAQHWGRRQVLALSAAMLIIFGVVVFYIYQASMRVKPSVVEATNQPPDTEGVQPDETPSAIEERNPRGGGSTKPSHGRNRASITPPATTPMISDQALEPPLLSQTAQFEQPVTYPEDPTDAAFDSDHSPRMLRIEIQTSDPNIRIIWFAPMEVEGAKTNQ